MAYNPSFLPSWPSGAPDYETTYRYAVPAQIPGLYSEESEANKDLEAIGIGLSYIRKMMWWVMERIWPWLDDDALFLERWEEVFGLEPTGTVATRQQRVVASMRNRGTLTLDVIKAIFEWVLGTTDPDDVSIVAPDYDDIWAGCVSWQNIDWPFDVTLDVTHISGHGGAYIWAVGASGMIKRFTTSWETIASGTGNNLNGVWAEPGNGDNAWAVGAGPTLLVWNGAAWAAGPVGGPAANIQGVWGCGRYYNATAAEHQARYIFTCGASQEISRYDRSAASWTNWTVGAAGDQWNKIHAVSKDEAYACSNNGKAAKWDGSSWTVWTVDGAEKFHGIRKMPDGKTYMVGTTGKCYWFSDATGVWTAMNTGTTNDLNDLDGWDEKRMIAVGSAGTCIRFHGRFDASDWEEIRTGTSDYLRSVWISRQTVDAMIAGDNGITKNSPPNDHGFVINQNSLHVYSTNEDLDPDYGIGWDKCRLCEPAWATFTVGRRRKLLIADASDASGLDNSCLEDSS